MQKHQPYYETGSSHLTREQSVAALGNRLPPNHNSFIKHALQYKVCDDDDDDDDDDHRDVDDDDDDDDNDGDHVCHARLPTLLQALLDDPFAAPSVTWDTHMNSLAEGLFDITRTGNVFAAATTTTTAIIS